MQIQFQYITNLAAEYKKFVDDSNELYRAINQLSEPALQDIYAEYSQAKFGFQPVNLLRAEVARQLLDGIEISEEAVEQIKNISAKKIRIIFHICRRNSFVSWKITESANATCSPTGRNLGMSFTSFCIAGRRAKRCSCIWNKSAGI